MAEIVGYAGTERSTFPSLRALIATMIVDSDMNTAPIVGDRRDADGSEDSRRKREREHVVAGRPDEVLLHLPVARLRQSDEPHHVQRVIVDEDDIPDSMATSVPEPMAIPTSALVSAGASLTPSPTIATNFLRTGVVRPSCPSPSGRTSAKYWSIPSSSETALATSSESPVSIATSMSIACSASIACRLSSPDNVRERECCDFGFVVNQIDDRLCVRTGFLSEGSDAVGSFDTEFSIRFGPPI